MLRVDLQSVRALIGSRVRVVLWGTKKQTTCAPLFIILNTLLAAIALFAPSFPIFCLHAPY